MRMMYENLDKSDKVIVVLSKGYAARANEFKGGVGNEYQGIINDIATHPKKYVLVSFGKRNNDIYPFGFVGSDTLVIKEGDLEFDVEERNRLFSKLTGEAIYEKPPIGSKRPTVTKK